MVDSIFGTLIAIVTGISGLFVIEKSPIKVNPLTLLKKFFVGDIIDSIKEIKQEAHENEMDRIRHTILEYKNDIVYGHRPITDNDFTYISNLHDKYKKLGGNSFETSVFEFIKKTYEDEIN